MHSVKKYIISLLVIILISFLIWNHRLIYYGLVQAKGQLTILLDAIPVSDYLDNPHVPDSLKARILLVNEIKQFAVEELGLYGNGNYQKIYDQQNQEIMWVVTACEPYQLIAKEWSFPFIGSFSYKGFFVYEMALRETEKLDQQGYDTSIRTADAWSTLGIFNDPVLSNLLNRSAGSLADVIIHEMTHSTIFVKDSLEFNENLPSFIIDAFLPAMIYLKVKLNDTLVIDNVPFNIEKINTNLTTGKSTLHLLRMTDENTVYEVAPEGGTEVY